MMKSHIFDKTLKLISHCNNIFYFYGSLSKAARKYAVRGRYSRIQDSGNCLSYTAYPVKLPVFSENRA